MADSVSVADLVNIAVILCIVLFFYSIFHSVYYERKAKKLIPKDWDRDLVFVARPLVAINKETKEIAFISSKEVTIVNFHDIKSWQHLWTEKTKVREAIIGRQVVNSTEDHHVKIITHGVKGSSISVYTNKYNAGKICDALSLHLG